MSGLYILCREMNKNKILEIFCSIHYTFCLYTVNENSIYILEMKHVCSTGTSPIKKIGLYQFKNFSEP